MKPFSKKEQYILLLDELARLHQATSGHFKEVHTTKFNIFLP